ncbi:MAG: hypothetical protein WBP42_15625 [Candidatus Zixiibacteriota bacterium]
MAQVSFRLSNIVATSAAIVVLCLAGSLMGQHQHEGMEPSKDSVTTGAKMQSGIFASAPMSRMGSGTSWHPDVSRLEAYHVMAGNWALMIHGNLYLRYNTQDIRNTTRNKDQQFDAPGWVMLMAQPMTRSRLQFLGRAMISVDRFSMGGDGYPLLLQTGETWNNQPLVDRQHPHEVFSELAVMTSMVAGEKVAIFGYFGYPGEPALGPPAFMHRPSALSKPDAALGHHWQDATHITFGVLTGGVQYGKAKFEGSLFTGREPDENRYNFDKAKFDSYSFRGSANIGDRAAAQVSWGFLESPERLEPEIDQRRTSASLLYQFPLGEQEYLAIALVWGMIDPTDSERLHSGLIEGEYELGSGSIYSRLEIVEKNAHELAIEELDSQKFTVGALTVGITRSVARFELLNVRVGAQVTFDRVPQLLEPYYGRTPVSAEVFLRLFPLPEPMNHNQPKSEPMRSMKVEMASASK